jgi:hypothetical protein
MTFEEFLEIPGCAVGAHTDVAAEPEQQPTTSSSAAALLSMKPTVRPDGSTVEVYGSTASVVKQAPAVQVKKKEVVVIQQEEQDPEYGTIAVGTACKRNVSYSTT